MCGVVLPGKKSFGSIFGSICFTEIHVTNTINCFSQYIKNKYKLTYQYKSKGSYCKNAAFAGIKHDKNLNEKNTSNSYFIFLIRVDLYNQEGKVQLVWTSVQGKRDGDR